MAMGPAHEVLGNTDLLWLIFPARADSGDEQHELFRLALVCRQFCAVALVILWRIVDKLENLYCLFPRDIIFTDADNTKRFRRLPSTRDHWVRFEAYTWRIRGMCLSFPDDHDLIVVLGRHFGHHNPFPRLLCLTWKIKTNSVPLVLNATFMICWTLAYISFHLHGDGPDRAMAEIIQVVKEKCTRLQAFEYHHDGKFIPTSTAFETSLVSLFKSSISLRKVTVPANYRVLDALALLPSLDLLSLNDSSEIKENEWIMAHSAGAQSPVQETFVALKSLNIWSSFASLDSLHLYLQSFRKIVSIPRVQLKATINSQDPHSSSELPRRLYDALHPNLRIGLEVFNIYQNCTIPQVHSWQSCSWLLESPRLRILSLLTNLLEIDDTAFARAAQAWPELQYISLVFSDRSVVPHAIFRGLVHLSLLPQLRDLRITIGHNCAIAPSLLYGEQTSFPSLRHLGMPGDFPNADPLHVALFLTKHFPNLETLYTLRDPRWQDMRLRITFLRKVLPKILNGPVGLKSGQWKAALQ